MCSVCGFPLSSRGIWMPTSFRFGMTYASCLTSICLCNRDVNHAEADGAQDHAGSFRELVSAARDVMPEVALTTDIIAGFPGETEEEFAESLEFVKKMNFAGGHVFTYSPCPGTGAAKMKGQIRPELRKMRNHILHDALEKSAKSYRQSSSGRRCPYCGNRLPRWGSGAGKWRA